MDAAVALVQAYLQVNGYFTVVEYPVLEALGRRATRTATDLDVLAFRFPRAGCETRVGESRRALGTVAYQPDPMLKVPEDQADMIVGEVKQGPARFNPAVRDPLVLSAALTRFGCCPPDGVEDTVKRLLRKGHATTQAGHRIRLVAFGSGIESGAGRHGVVTTAHMLDFLRAHLRQHWSYLGQTQMSQPTLAFLALTEKASRAPSSVATRRTS